MTKLPTHLLVYGLPGSGKTTFASRFQIYGPQLVLMADAAIKATPYLAHHRIERPDANTLLGFAPETSTPAVRVELYHDANVRKPTAFTRLEARLEALVEEVSAGAWASVVLDTMSAFELRARHFHQFVLNKGSKEPRQWYAGATELLEQLCLVTLAGLPCHVILLTHVDEDKDEVHGAFVRHPRAPGRLRTRMSEQWEVVRAYVEDHEAGKRKPAVYRLQTQRRDGYYASVQQRRGEAPADPLDPDPRWFVE